jgi:hemoglobin
MTNFEIMGGEKALRSVLKDFYDRVFADPMIGYLFAASNQQELIDREYEFTARIMGKDIEYRGKTMREAHGKHRILSGHFNRRHRLLELVLNEHEVPTQVQDVWLSHMLSLRAAVVGTASNPQGCDGPNSAAHGGVSEH